MWVNLNLCCFLHFVKISRQEEARVSIISYSKSEMYIFIYTCSMCKIRKLFLYFLLYKRSYCSLKWHVSDNGVICMYFVNFIFILCAVDIYYFYFWFHLNSYGHSLNVGCSGTQTRYVAYFLRIIFTSTNVTVLYGIFTARTPPWQLLW